MFGPIGWAWDKVTGFVGDVATEGFEMVIGGLVAWVLDAVVWIVQGVFNYLIDAADPNVQADWFVARDGPYATMATIGASLMATFLCAGIAQGVLAGDVGGMLRRMALDLPMAVLGMVGLVTVTQALVRLTDQLTSWVLAGFQEEMDAFVDAVGSIANLGGGVATAFVVFVLGLVAVLAGIVLIGELAVRSALVYIVVALAPLAFAAQLWPGLKGTSQKLLKLVGGHGNRDDGHGAGDITGREEGLQPRGGHWEVGPAGHPVGPVPGGVDPDVVPPNLDHERAGSGGHQPEAFAQATGPGRRLGVDPFPEQSPDASGVERCPGVEPGGVAAADQRPSGEAQGVGEWVAIPTWTSGTVVVAKPVASDGDADGDLVADTGAGQVDDLAVGAARAVPAAAVNPATVASGARRSDEFGAGDVSDVAVGRELAEDITPAGDEVVLLGRGSEHELGPLDPDDRSEGPAVRVMDGTDGTAPFPGHLDDLQASEAGAAACSGRWPTVAAVPSTVDPGGRPPRPRRRSWAATPTPAGPRCERS